jgi:hypothetical protein
MPRAEKIRVFIWYLIVASFCIYAISTWDEKATDALRVTGPMLIALFVMWNSLDRKIESIKRQIK